MPVLTGFSVGAGAAAAAFGVGDAVVGGPRMVSPALADAASVGSEAADDGALAASTTDIGGGADALGPEATSVQGAADGGERTLESLARDFRAVDQEGNVIRFPENPDMPDIPESPQGTVDHMVSGPNGNRFEQIIQRFGLKSNEEAFGLIRSTIESGTREVQGSRLVYELNGLRVVVLKDYLAVYTAYPI
jgi:hypothetical protein